MSTSNRKSAAPIVAALVIAFVALVAASTAHAQISATNNSSCNILLTLVDGGGHLSAQFLVPSGGVLTVLPTPAGYAPVGVEDIDGRTRRFSPAPPASGCTSCIPLPQQGSNDPCCVTVCFDPSAQKITISGCSPCQ